MTDAEATFVDTNILVFAATRSSPYHAAARRALAEERSEGRALWINRQVVREYLATMSRPQGERAAVAMSVLLADLARWIKSFEVADEDERVSNRLLELLGEVPVGGKQVHDANIVATMLACGVSRLLTHNISDFRRFVDRIAIVSLNAGGEPAAVDAPGLRR